MNQKNDLVCLYYHDLLPWERQGVEPIIRFLSQRYRVEQIEINENDRFDCAKANANAVWVLSGNWRKAVSSIKRNNAGPRVYASVFGLSPTMGSLFTLLWRRLNPSLPSGLTLLAHSPINYRFFHEIEGMKKGDVVHVPLPFSSRLSDGLRRTEGQRAPVVGIYANFTPESNLNYFLNVAHYISTQRPDVHFRVLGSGALYPHIHEMVRELDLESSVFISETIGLEELSDVDVLAYVPIRNDHFIPILAAGAAKIPVVCSEIPGIESLVHEGKHGYVISANETKPLGEKTVFLLDRPELRKSMGSELGAHLAGNFSESQIATNYASLFFDKSQWLNELEKAA